MNGVTEHKLTEFTKRIAYKLALDYGLMERDFAIRYWESTKFDYAIKAGGIIRVYFTHTPKFVDYETMLRRCLQQVALIKKNKRTGIIIYGSDKQMTDDLHKEFGKEWEQLPTLLPFEQFKFETLYKVTMTHYKTGLTVIKEGHIGKYGKTIPRLMIDARLELSDLVDALERARASDEKAKIASDSEKLKMANYGDSESES